MIERQGKDSWGRLLYDVNCDRCSYSEEFAANDFDHLRKQMKHDKWTNQLVDEEWLNVCPACSQEKANASAYRAGARRSINPEDIP